MANNSQAYQVRSGKTFQVKKIFQKDVLWNYAASLLKISSSVLLFPLILSLMASDVFGILSLFITLSSLIFLLDFGFSPSFTRNVSYVFGGVTELKQEGITSVIKNNGIDTKLLEKLISTMRWFYRRMSILLLAVLLIFGTLYLSYLLKQYKGNHYEIYFAWFLFCLVSAFNLNSFYLEPLLMGSGMISASKKITILSQIVYLLAAVIALLLNFGLIGLVASQFLSIILNRMLSKRAFFKSKMKNALKDFSSIRDKEMVRAIYPNAFKLGLTLLGGFMVQRASILIGAIYLPLNEIASYGISYQIASLVGMLSGIFIATNLPKIMKHRVNKEYGVIKDIYKKGQAFSFLLFVIFGGFVLLFGSDILQLLKSNTTLLPENILFTLFILVFIESYFSAAGNFLLTKNSVPFFKASLISGITIVLLLFILFEFFIVDIWILVLVPLVVDLSYQAWKWPLEVIRDFRESKLVEQ